MRFGGRRTLDLAGCRWRRLLAVPVALAVLAGCQTGTDRPLPASVADYADDVAQGREAHEPMLRAFGGRYENRMLAAYVDRVGQRVADATEASDLPFTFTVLNSDYTNAFALSGGYVYITRGMLALLNSEDELAAVLAHEVAHVVARHVAVRRARFPDDGENPIDRHRRGQFTQAQEGEADRLGIGYLAAAGYDPGAAVRLLAQLERDADIRWLSGRLSPTGSSREHSYLATHPPTDARIAWAEAEVAGLPPRPPQADRFLDHVIGMRFGPGVDQPLIWDSAVLIPTRGVTWSTDIPYRLQRAPWGVSAEELGGGRFVFDYASAETRGLSAQDYLEQEWAADHDLERIEALTINGFDAAIGYGEARIGGERIHRRLVAIHAGGIYYRFQFFIPLDRLWGAKEDTIAAIVGSFRATAAEDAALMRPRELVVETVAADQRAVDFARRMAVDGHRMQRFLALNGLDRASEVQPGDRVKLIVYRD